MRRNTSFMHLRIQKVFVDHLLWLDLLASAEDLEVGETDKVTVGMYFTSSGRRKTRNPSNKHMRKLSAGVRRELKLKKVT